MSDQNAGEPTPAPPTPPAPGYPPPAQQYAPPAVAAPPPAAAPPAYAPPAAPPAQAPAPAYAPPGYTPYPAGPKTNVLAIVSLITSVVGLVFCWTGVLWLAAIAGVITGHISLRQLKTSGENGHGMALAGTIVGWVALGLGVVLLAALVIPFVIVMVVGAGAASTGYLS